MKDGYFSGVIAMDVRGVSVGRGTANLPLPTSPALARTLPSSLLGEERFCSV